MRPSITAGLVAVALALIPIRGPQVDSHIRSSNRSALNYPVLPIRFEPNVGQVARPVQYFARGMGYGISLSGKSVVLNLRDPAQGAASLSLSVAGTNAAPSLSPEQRQSSVSNYFIGNDPSKWRTNVANYAAVRYEQVYPGIDWVVYGNPHQLEYDFVVAPQADPRQIELRVSGARSISLDSNGDLLIDVQGRILRQLKPVIFQTGGHGARQTVSGHYVLAKRGVVFALGDYDHSRELVIDPAFVYSTYLGGSGGDAASAIAVDGAGNTYVAGITSSSDFPSVNPFQATNHSAAADHPSNAFVTKFNAAGRQLVYSTYLGGSGIDTAQGIAVDGAGNAYIVGSTSSTDFPTAAPYQATNRAVSPTNYPTNAFVTKLNPSGSALVYSTYLGGSGPTGSEATSDGANAVAVDSAGNAYVVGHTASTDFPTVNPFQATFRGGSVIGSNAFVAKFNASGSALLYSTYLGGSFSDGASGVAVDSAGSAYVVGSTGSPDFPTAAPFQASSRAVGAGRPAEYLGPWPTAFLTKFDAAGSTLAYSTYLGGSCSDGAAGVAVNSVGNAYVTGVTCSTDFPTVNPLQATNHSVAGSTNPYNAFVAEFNVAGSGLVYSTYLGGSNDDEARAIALDSAGNAYVAGFTFSEDFPLAVPLQGINNGAANNAANAFVSVLNATGSSLTFSTYLGGSGSVAAAQEGRDDSANAIAADSMGNLYVAGVTYSTDFPTVMALQSSNESTDKAATSGSAFVTQIAMTQNATAQQLSRSGVSGGGGAMGWGLICVLTSAIAMRRRRQVSA
jgi:hypothetical protein